MQRKPRATQAEIDGFIGEFVRKETSTLAIENKTRDHTLLYEKEEDANNTIWE